MDIIGYINTQAPVASWSADKKQRMLDSLADRFDYIYEVMDDPDPPTKKEFINQIIIDHIKRWVNEERKLVAKQSVTYEIIDFN